MADMGSFDEFYAGAVGRLVSQLFPVTGDLHEAEEVVRGVHAGGGPLRRLAAVAAVRHTPPPAVGYRESDSQRGDHAASRRPDAGGLTRPPPWRAATAGPPGRWGRGVCDGHPSHRQP
jgi:hypothetical protein